MVQIHDPSVSIVPNSSSYSATFYRRYEPGAAESAAEVVPFILHLTGARSVVDLGCGTGAWLSAYAANGVEDYCGIEGPWLSPELLTIPRASFRVADLRGLPAADRRYDLVQSLEVAEHLESTYADSFVKALVSRGDIVVFSAAIPRQGGVHHVNEQWHSYWRELFARHDYRLYDAFRPSLWLNDRVSWWYAQNMFLYVRSGREPSTLLQSGLSEGYVFPERIVHPGKLAAELNGPVGLRRAASQFIDAIACNLSRSFKRARTPGYRQK